MKRKDCFSTYNFWYTPYGNLCPKRGARKRWWASRWSSRRRDGRVTCLLGWKIATVSPFDVAIDRIVPVEGKAFARQSAHCSQVAAPSTEGPKHRRPRVPDTVLVSPMSKTRPRKGNCKCAWLRCSLFFLKSRCASASNLGFSMAPAAVSAGFRRKRNWSDHSLQSTPSSRRDRL